MNGTASFVACDWGTTSARFWLCDAAGDALDQSDGAGVAQCGADGDFGAILEDVCAGWPRLPAFLCGTIGSNIGWLDAGYQDAPIGTAELGHRAIRFDHDGREIAILPGVRCTNPFGEPDIMRGEETQIAGACAFSDLTDALFVLPGTHNKWAVVEGSQLRGFFTALSGELFAALSQQSILLARDSEAARPGAAFDEGVALALRHGTQNLLSLLFAVRVRFVDGRLAGRDTASFLSGVVIGADVAGALPIIESTKLPLHLICSEALGISYARALEIAGHGSARLSGGECARRGLALAFGALGRSAP